MSTTHIELHAEKNDGSGYAPILLSIETIKSVRSKKTGSFLVLQLLNGETAKIQVKEKYSEVKGMILLEEDGEIANE